MAYINYLALSTALLAASVSARQLTSEGACCIAYSGTLASNQIASLVSIPDTVNDCKTIAGTAAYVETQDQFCVIPFALSCATIQSEGVLRYSGSISSCATNSAQATGAITAINTYLTKSSQGENFNQILTSW